MKLIKKLLTILLLILPLFSFALFRGKDSFPDVFPPEESEDFIFTTTTLLQVPQTHTYEPHRFLDQTELMASGTPLIYGSDSALLSFSKEGHMMILPVFINDFLIPYYFLLDTGASTVIDDDLAVQLGLGPFEIQHSEVGEDGSPHLTEFGLIDSLEVGDVVVENIAVSVFDIDLIDDVSAFPIRGILGSNFFRFFELTFDFENQTVRFALNIEEEPAEGFEYVMNFESTPEKGYVPIIPVTIDGPMEAEAIIDTGASGYIVLPEDDLQEVSDPDDETLSSVGVVGSGASGPIQQTYLSRMDTFVFGNFRLMNLPFRTRDIEEMLIGMDILSQFKLKLNYPEKEMTLIPRGDLCFAQDVVSLGMSILADENNNVVISGFWEGSPTEEAGIGVGARILEVNGIPVDEISIMELKEYLTQNTNSVVEILVQEAEGEKTFYLEPESLFSGP